MEKTSSPIGGWVRMGSYFATALRNPRTGLQVILERVFPKDPELKRMARWRYGAAPRVHPQELFSFLAERNITILRAFDREAGRSVDAYELFCLCAMVGAIQARHILEIGTFYGNTALNLAANSPPDAQIVTVDLPPDFSGELALELVGEYTSFIDRTKIGWQFENTAQAKKITQVLQDSAKLDWGELPGPFDVVFIDGCHDRNYVQSDTEHAVKHTRHGGIIVWHDYGDHKEVSEVVDGFADRLTVRALRGTRLAVGILPG